ncbi:unnamed protein product [Ectocarpus sp. 4 AP-2014]
MAEAGRDTIPNVSFRNVLELIAEVQLCREQARLLVAGRLLAAVDRYLASGQHAERHEVKEAHALLGGELKPLFDEVRLRAAECQSSLDDWQSVRVNFSLYGLCRLLVSHSRTFLHECRGTVPAFPGSLVPKARPIQYWALFSAD